MNDRLLSLDVDPDGASPFVSKIEVEATLSVDGTLDFVTETFVAVLTVPALKIKVAFSGAENFLAAATALPFPLNVFRVVWEKFITDFFPLFRVVPLCGVEVALRFPSWLSPFCPWSVGLPLL
jgi:hypothetical protein